MVNNEVKKRIDEQVENNKEEAVEFLQKLINAPSTSGNEYDAQMFTKKKLEEIGCEVDVWEPDINKLIKCPYFVNNRDNFKNSPNVVGTKKGVGGGKSLILNGHIDVVPVGEEIWYASPWSGYVEGDKLYGRGASDMKGGNVSMIMSVKCLQDLGFKLKGDIIIQSVIEEESGGAGTLSAILRGYRADGGIVTEPSNLKIFPAQQGSYWFRIKVKGKAAHGASRYEGISAIEKSYIVIKVVEELETRRNLNIENPLYRQGEISFPINIGKIYGGNWPSSVPGEVFLEGRMGVIPGESLKEARRQLKEAVYEASAQDPWLKDNLPELEWFGAQWISGEISQDHEIVKLIQDNYEHLKGKKAEIKMAPWATDSGYLTHLSGTPTVVFGPGSTAHCVDEYISLSNLQEATKIIAATILEWCGNEE